MFSVLIGSNKEALKFSVINVIQIAQFGKQDWYVVVSGEIA